MEHVHERIRESACPCIRIKIHAQYPPIKRRDTRESWLCTKIKACAVSPDKTHTYTCGCVHIKIYVHTLIDLACMSANVLTYSTNQQDYLTSKEMAAVIEDQMGPHVTARER
jgi:hypothetical protein